MINPADSGIHPAMKGLFRLAGWWKRGPAAPSPAIPFQINCSCGQIIQGFREHTHQVLRCNGCSRELFVLPASPLPPAAAPGALAALPENVRSGRSPWFWPIVAGLLTLVVVVGGFAAAFLWLIEIPEGAAPTAAEIDTELAGARKALREGELQRAAQELDRLQTTVTVKSQAATPGQREELRQLHRQAVLLADWSGESLEQILARTAPLKFEEWQAVAERYRGKPFVFDLELRRDASRRYHVIRYGGKDTPPGVRLEVQNLRLLAYLPLEEPQRVLFGARVAELRRQGEVCTVRLEGDSGVLLTDVTSTVIGGTIPELVLQPILKQQRQWAAGLP
jgi:hypothetical protein